MIKKRQLIFIIIFSLGLQSSQKTDDDYFEISKNLKIMSSVYEKLFEHYVDEIIPGRVMKQGIDAMLKSLDPYTAYISESQIEDFRFTTTGEYGGIGASIKKLNDKMIVTELFESSPALKAGVLAGDEIITIDKIKVEDKSLEEVGTLLKGPSESKILLEIKREEVTIIKNVVREVIQIPAVRFFKKISQEIGYIKLNSFTTTAASEFKSAFLKLREEKLEKLIIDLRSNGGGLLNEAVKIVNLFVPKEELVVSTKSRNEQMNRTYICRAQPLDTIIPIIVLIDEMSASASEIVAGSFQDLDRALIIGNTSYGKGLVQQTKQVSFGGQIKLTVAKYYTPSGRCIQKIDYSNSENGKSMKIEDSLVNKFKTKNGREVTDSRGIEPDIKIEPDYFNAITEALLRDEIIFNFTNRTISHYDTIIPSNFNVSDTTYQKFINYVLNQDLDYQTSSNFHFEKLKEVAIKEKYLKENKELFIQMENKFKTNVEKDLLKHNEEIKFFF
jgi:carboxyl-terminal processing protease